MQAEMSDEVKTWQKQLIPCIIVISMVSLTIMYRDSILLLKHMTAYVEPLTIRGKESMLDNHTRTTSEISKDLISIGNNTFYVFTMVAQLSENKTLWKKLYVTGWEKLNQNPKYKCCLKYKDGTTSESKLLYRVYGLSQKNHLQSRQVVCPMSIPTVGPRPQWASITMPHQSCNKTTFTRVEYRHPNETNQFAICGKIAYGKKPAKYIIEWIEYHRYLGVSKLLIYTYYDLHEPALRVLNYYVSQGILETVKLPSAPERVRFPRYFSVQNSTQMWHDEKVPLMDAEQRLHGYKYLAVIDTDEFIVPKMPGVTNLTGLMEGMLKKYPNAGNFRMKSEMHIMHWNKTHPNSDLLIEQYGFHTPAKFLTEKLINVLDRVREGTVWIHSSQAKATYKTIVPDPATDFIYKHFRKCKDWWLTPHKDYKPNKCLGGFKRIRDTYMQNIVKIIGPEVRRVTSVLNL